MAISMVVMNVLVIVMLDGHECVCWVHSGKIERVEKQSA